MSMLAVTASTYSDPSGYELSTLPRPTVSQPTDIIIRVHAASINPIDVKKASGALKIALRDENARAEISKFPYKIGYDCAGVVEAIGSEVSRLKVADEVYARLPEAYRGSWSEYAKCAERYVALKPKSLSFEDAASIPLAAMTAFQALGKYKGSLIGKTVLVPAGLSGTGAYACQLAKNVFKAGKVITTVSTTKVPLVPELLGKGVVDQIIDYTKSGPNDIIPPASVDFVLDTTGQAMHFLSLMVPKTSLIISISTQPSGLQLQQADFMNRQDHPQLSWWARGFLDTIDAVRKLRAWRWSVQYSYLFLYANAEDLQSLSEYVESGKLLPVVGSRAELRDIASVTKLANLVYEGKGGIGKAVIAVI